MPSRNHRAQHDCAAQQAVGCANACHSAQCLNGRRGNLPQQINNNFIMRCVARTLGDGSIQAIAATLPRSLTGKAGSDSSTASISSCQQR